MTDTPPPAPSGDPERYAFVAALEEHLGGEGKYAGIARAELLGLYDARRPAPNAGECEHDWHIWPETDGQSQRCTKCKAYRDTPPAPPASEPVAWKVTQHADGRVQFSIEQQTFTIQYYPDARVRDMHREWYARQLHVALSKLARNPVAAPPAQPGWRGIESAPKDGKSFLACNVLQGCLISIRWWNRSYERWDGPREALCQFTHWQPLPPAPLPRGEG